MNLLKPRLATDSLVNCAMVARLASSSVIKWPFASMWEGVTDFASTERPDVADGG